MLRDTYKIWITGRFGFCRFPIIILIIDSSKASKTLLSNRKVWLIGKITLLQNMSILFLVFFFLSKKSYHCLNYVTNLSSGKLQNMFCINILQSVNLIRVRHHFCIRCCISPLLLIHVATIPDRKEVHILLYFLDN